MRLCLAVGLMVFAAAADAQSLSTRTAADQLFSPDREVIQASGNLSKKDQATLKKLVPLMEQQMQRSVDFYSSIAYVPSIGLVSEGLQGAFNYHSPAAADRAALRACAAAKPAGSGDCRIAARVLPRGFKERSLTMSADATRAFEGRYRRASSPKVFAISPSTGAWGFGSSPNEAVAGCARAGASDCAPVIEN